MRSSEDNPLDLNNFPEDFSRDSNKQVFEASSSSSAHRKKKSTDKEGKDECGKVYECRFCSLKFCKSQALGGHMNRHRQERETETLNRARQLVFGNDTLAASSLAHPHLGCPSIPGVYHPGGTNIGDTASLGFRSIYPSGRMFSGSNPSSLSSSPFHQQYNIYQSHSPSRVVSLTPQYYHHHHHHQRHHNPPNEYCIGHVLTASSSSQHSPNYSSSIGRGVNESNYSCMGAPLGPGLLPGRVGNEVAGVSSGGIEVGGSGGGGEGHGHHHHHHDQEGMMMMNWERSYGGGRGGGGGTGTQQRVDPGSLNNRFQDGF